MAPAIRQQSVNMKRIIYILVILFWTNFVHGQVYQSMPQYGYGPVKRMDLDSSLTIPTTCGVPTLKTYITKKAAIAYDSCNKRFYYYDPKLLAWDTIKGGGGSSIDTTSLSNRINDKIDSLKKSGDSVYFKKNGIWFTSFKDSAGSGQNGRWGNDTALVILAKVHNDAGSTLLRGEVVYLSGANGDVASVKRANNKYDSTSATTIGMIKDNIAVNDTGWVVTQGQISKINTAAFNPGDIIYMDSIDGQFTKTKQYAPYHLVFIGVVERANAGNGQLYIKPQNGYELNELHDVQITSPINNQVLVYSDTQQLWKNRSVYSVVDTTSLSNRINSKQDDFFNVLSIMGGSYKSKTLGMEFLGSLSSLAMVDGTQYFIPIYLSKSDTIKGINFYQRVQGAYTADNYNGVALYSYSGGTVTLIDTTANNGNLWKGTANTWQSVDFVNKVYCQKGLYYISLLYNTSLQSAGPSIQSGGSVGGTNFPQHPLNTIRIYSSLAGRTSPISSQSLTSTTSHQNNAFILIY